jgi:hypothetical protein
MIEMKQTPLKYPNIYSLPLLDPELRKREILRAGYNETEV